MEHRNINFAPAIFFSVSVNEMRCPVLLYAAFGLLAAHVIGLGAPYIYAALTGASDSAPRFSPPPHSIFSLGITV
jgi:hypothetical protein